MVTLNKLALLSPIYITLILSVVLIYQGWKVNRPKTILGIFMLSSFVFFTAVYVTQVDDLNISRFSDPVFHSFMLLLHPLFYQYIRSLTISRTNSKYQILHFIPAITILLLSVYFYLQLSKDDQLIYMYEYKFGYKTHHPVFDSIATTLKITKLIHVLQAILYFTLGFRLLRKHKANIGDMFSYESVFRLNWLYIFNFIYIGMTVNGIIMNVIPHQVLNTQEIYLTLGMGIFSAFYLSLGNMGIQQSPVVEKIEELDASVETRIPQVNLENVHHRVLDYIMKEKAYLNPELRIWDICKLTNINRIYISRAINDYTGMNFNQYINNLRIEYACKQLQKKNNRHSIDAIANASGFKSISSFNRVFKDLLGQTPTEYQKKYLTPPS